MPAWIELAEPFTQDLLAPLVQSFAAFLQRDTSPSERKLQGLHAALTATFPLVAEDRRTAFTYDGYSFHEPRYNVVECRRRPMVWHTGHIRLTVRMICLGPVESTAMKVQHEPVERLLSSTIERGAPRAGQRRSRRNGVGSTLPAAVLTRRCYSRTQGRGRDGSSTSPAANRSPATRATRSSHAAPVARACSSKSHRLEWAG